MTSGLEPSKEVVGSSPAIDEERKFENKCKRRRKKLFFHDLKFNLKKLIGGAI